MLFTADHDEPPRKAPSGGWVALSDWGKVGKEMTAQAST